MEHSAVTRSKVSAIIFRILLGLGMILSQQPKILHGTDWKSMGPQWDSPLFKLLSFNFAWVVPVCQVGYEWAFLMNTLMLPVSLTMLVTATWSVRRKTNSTGVGEWDNKLVAVRQRDYYWVAFLTYPTMTCTFFNHFNCRRLEQSRWVLQEDYGVDCYTTSWYVLAVVSVLGILFLSIGAPAGMLVWQFRYHNKQMWLVRLALKSRVSAYSEFRLKFGYMTADFKPEAYYSECVDLVRKLMLTGVISWIFPGTVFQVNLLVLFCLVCS